ncbi:MAG: hypothetical protein AAF310_04450 [Myxococcota bacterium]
MLVGTLKRQTRMLLACLALASTATLQAQELGELQDELQNEQKKIPLNRSRSTLFGNVGFAGQVQFSTLFTSDFQAGTIAGGGLSLEQPLNRYFVMGAYVAGHYLSTKAYEFTVDQQTANSTTVTLVRGEQKGSGTIEGGGLIKIRLPFNKEVAWYFPIAGGVGALFDPIGTQFMGAFHISPVGVEALFNQGIGITFNTMTSIHKAQGPAIFSNSIQLGLIAFW